MRLLVTCSFDVSVDVPRHTAEDLVEAQLQHMLEHYAASFIVRAAFQRVA